MGGWGGCGVSGFFYYESKFKIEKKNFWRGGGGGAEFFYYESKFESWGHNNA